LTKSKLAEFEISTKFCPYLQARSFFQKFFPKNVTLEYLENFHKNNPQSKYPSLPDFIHYKNKKSSKTKKKTKSPIKCPFGYSSSSPFFSHPKKNSSDAKCPFGFSDNDSEKDLNEINLDTFNINDKDFDIFEFDKKVGKENTLSLIGNYIFKYFSFEEILNQTKYKNWCQKISEGYNRNNSYHTHLHAADIVHTSFIYFKEGLINEIIKLDKSSICALFLSCICHDYKHPGLNNNYLMETNNSIAIRYNDISILENMHISETFKLILSDKNYNIFDNLEKQKYKGKNPKTKFK